jgi:hypothetical protein
LRDRPKPAQRARARGRGNAACPASSLEGRRVDPASMSAGWGRRSSPVRAIRRELG